VREREVGRRREQGEAGSVLMPLSPLLVLLLLLLLGGSP
jgi:hypothetical protein